VKRLEAPLCARCGAPLGPEGGCPRCRRLPLRLARTRSAAVYEDGVRRAILDLKYRGVRVLAPDLAPLLVETWRADAFAAEAILPVPLHWRRLRERGYNQAELLAEALGAAVGVPVWPTALRRVRHTPPQVATAGADRHRNVAGAFAADPAVVAGRHLVVVDDVLSTTQRRG
jgi:predicted amidophosphoribosyltransferase